MNIEIRLSKMYNYIKRTVKVMGVNKSICPICGKHNNCAYEKGLSHGGCWCENIKVPKALREQIPENLRGKSCICKECVIAYKEKNEK